MNDEEMKNNSKVFPCKNANCGSKEKEFCTSIGYTRSQHQVFILNLIGFFCKFKFYYFFKRDFHQAPVYLNSMFLIHLIFDFAPRYLELPTEDSLEKEVYNL